MNLSYYQYMVVYFLLCIIWIMTGSTGFAAEPIDPNRKIEQYNLTPFPASLEVMRGTHPRIFLNKKRIAELRKLIQTTHAPYWDHILAQADRAVKSGPPAYLGYEERGGSGGQHYQGSLGETLPVLAIAYLMTEERRYLYSAREWALVSCSYKTWGLGWKDGMDLSASRQLFGLGIVYDWCYDSLGEGTRRIIRDTLVKRASAMFARAITGRMADRVRMDIWNPYWEEWPTQYLQNHLWINSCGLAVAGLALYDEVDNSSQWVGFTLHRFQRTMTVLGDDGASPEGVSYWAYGIEYLLKFMYLSRDLLNVNMYDNEWFRNTAKYRQYLALPQNSWTPGNNVVNLGDCTRTGGHSSVYQLHALAKEYGDGHAQWLAQQLFNTKVGLSSWLDLFWFDPTVKAKSPNELPTLYHFKDMDIVSARTDWSGNESLIVFKCGPYIGHKALQVFKEDPDGQHVHPDANHFVLFGGGEWLIRDDGYHDKWTEQHNTLLIDGRGQLGEGRPYFNGDEPMEAKARPRVNLAVSFPQLDHIIGDATEAYSRELGLRHYVRHLLFLKPDVLIVVDDIALIESKDIELLFHPEHPISELDSNAFHIRGEKNLLRVEFLTPEGVNLSTRNSVARDLRGDSGKEDVMYTVRCITNRSQWRNAVSFSWAKVKEEPVRVTLDSNGEKWIFTAGNRTVVLDWTTGEAEIQ